MATLITCFRILASASLLLCQPLSPAFYVLYIAAGISDMIDGPVARRTGTAGDFGAKLDTAADFSFMAVCLYKLLPVLDVPIWLWVWIALIALIKAVNIVFGFVVRLFRGAVRFIGADPEKDGDPKQDRRRAPTQQTDRDFFQSKGDVDGNVDRKERQ